LVIQVRFVSIDTTRRKHLVSDTESFRCFNNIGQCCSVANDEQAQFLSSSHEHRGSFDHSLDTFVWHERADGTDILQFRIKSEFLTSPFCIPWCFKKLSADRIWTQNNLIFIRAKLYEAVLHL